MTFTIRMANLADIEALAAIAKACVVQTPSMYNYSAEDAACVHPAILADRLRYAITAAGFGGQRVVLIEQAGVIAGFVRLTRGGGNTYHLGASTCIREVNVDPEHQGRGIGANLLQAALRLAVAEDWWPVLGEVHLSQPPHVARLNRRMGLRYKATSLGRYQLMVSAKRVPAKVQAYPLPHGWQPWYAPR